MSVSIRSRLLLLAAALLLPAAAALGWVVWQSLEAEQRAMQTRLQDSARALNLVVEQQLAQRSTIARVLALSRTLDGPGEPGPDKLQYFVAQARRAMQGMGGWVELRSVRGELLSTRTDSPYPAATGASAPDGGEMPLRTASPLLEHPAVSALEHGAADGTPLVVLTEPVVREGKVVLNVRVILLPQQLQALVESQPLPQDWMAAVLDDRNVVVARKPGGMEMVGRTASASLHEKLARSKEALFESTSLDGHPVVGYFSTSAPGWRYLISVPKATLFASTREAVLPMLVAALVLLLVGAGGALLVARRIAGPVHALELAASELQAGRTVPATRTGIAECDAVFRGLSEASVSLSRAHAELQLRVEEAVARTRETEQRASQGHRDEALGRLTGGVAHDFNNLLGVISNSAHLIERQASQPALQAPLQAILRSVHMGSRLTQHLLRFAGRQAVKPQSLRLGNYLNETQELLRAVLGRRVSLEIIVAPDTRRLWADGAELELALINLALNARSAMASGGQVWLRARNATDDEVGDLPSRDAGYLMISFADSGRGVSDDVAEHMFEPFFTTQPMGSGSGLGLSQVQGFCRQAGGTARAASTPGLGTTIMLLLPAMEPQADGAAPPPQAAPDPEAVLQGRQVLVVDDNEELGRVTAALLVSFGCEVTRAASARAALTLYEVGGPFDVVLTDIVMPGEMDGISLARELRRRQPDLPIVLVTGYSNTQASAEEFPLLHKPCTPKLLMATLQQAIEARVTTV